MKFEWRNILNCADWSLAHSITATGEKWPKGTLLTPENIKKIANLGIDEVQVFRLETNDINEDDAAKAAADHICGKGLKVIQAGRGRANITANATGLFLPSKAIDNLNMLDDAFSASSLPSHAYVYAGQLVATIKLVPYAISKDVLISLNKQTATAEVHAFNASKAAMITTGDDISDKVKRTLEFRLNKVGSNIVNYIKAEHTQSAVTQAIKALKHSDVNLILILGASAISDKRDVIPAALKAANGTVIKLGMPTDPGNLLMLGELEGKHIIGLPGCARSPALNGLDFILERIAAQLPIDHQTLTMLGTGGLLKEMPGRQVPRTLQPKPKNSALITSIILAAGKASRAKGISKLLSKIGAKTVLETTLDNVTSHAKGTVHLVTGHNAEVMKHILSEFDLTVVHNAEYAQGMGSSLAAGVSSLDGETAYAMICLADMPFIRPSTYKALSQVAQQSHEGAIIIPTFHGKRGHPVLWHRRYFSELSLLNADVGGKHILQNAQDNIIELPVDDAGILIDLDTPEMLSQFGITLVNQ